MTAKVEAERSHTVAEVCQLKSVSKNFVLAAIHRTDGSGLRAKKVGKGYRIDASAINEWWAAMPDA